MGIFDKLDKLVGKVTDQVGAQGAHIGDVVSKSMTDAGIRSSGIMAQSVVDRRMKARYFASILTQDFPQFQFQECVPATELGGTGQTFDFVLYQGGQVMAVVILVDHNRDNNRYYHGARQTAQAAGVPFINFYTHMSNEHDYVVARIRRFLGI